MTSITVTASDNTRWTASLSSDTVSELSDYYILLYDFQIPQYYRVDWGYSVPRMLFSSTDGLRNDLGYPSTVPATERNGRSLTSDIQWYWFNLCVRQQYRTVYGTSAWNALTRTQRERIATEWCTFTDSRRFATNHTGTDVRKNYIAERILGRASNGDDLPIQWEVACSGNIIKAVSHTPVRRGGEDCIQFEVWDGRNPDALTFNHDTHPHLVHMATNSTPFKSGTVATLTNVGPWKVNPFHFFGGVGSPFPLYFSSPNYMPLSRCRRLTVAERAAWRSPYVS